MLADDVLDRQAEAQVVGAAAVDLDALEQLEDGGAGVPGQVQGGFDDVVAEQRGDGDDARARLSAAISR